MVIKALHKYAKYIKKKRGKGKALALQLYTMCVGEKRVLWDNIRCVAITIYF